MRKQHDVYIAGTGMITPVGENAAMTAAAVNAGISGYQLSEFDDTEGIAVRMSLVPEDVFLSYPHEVDEGNYYSDHYDHVIKMGLMALRECLAEKTLSQPIPLLIGLPEPITGCRLISREPLVTNFMRDKELPISNDLIRTLSTGRSAGIQAIDMAFNYFKSTNSQYALIGGSDSYCNFALIRHLCHDDRLLTENAKNGFVAGEAAGFVLLTSCADNALVINDHVIAVHAPGLAEEPGHLLSDEVYRGDGLSQAFTKALNRTDPHSVERIYSSMNGEHYWAKEMGVATMRNRHFFKSDYIVEHPLDCLGDIGAATAPVLIGLAAMNLLKDNQQTNSLVYSSSDSQWRGAVRLEKQRYQKYQG